MKSRLFIIGFGVSAILLLVCAAYAFAPSWKTNFDLFFSRDAGYVGSAPAFRYAMAAFVILNVPAVLAAIGVLYVLDAVLPLADRARVFITFGLLLVTAFGWWWLVGHYIARRAARQSHRVRLR